MRVLHVANKQLRRYGKTHGNWVEKLAFGLIKNNHYLLTFSERDVAAFEAPWGLRDLGWRKANQRLLEMVEATEPDLVILGHCDKISDDTVREIRRMRPHALLAHVNCDPLFVPSNFNNLKARAAIVDAVFITTGKRDLTPFDGLGARIYHMPNPVDPAMEPLDNSARTDLDIDLLFCSNATKFSTRGVTVQHLKDGLGDSINFKTPGSFGDPPVWGRDYDRTLARTRMALNLNRQEGDYWYTSDRMAQLAGNGILQFTHASQGFQDLLPPESMVYFNDNDDLLAKVREFHHDDARRQAWASRCREFFHAEMNATLYARYIVEATMAQPFSHDYVWARDVRPDGSLK
jgi:hypothetical protein